MPYFLPLQKKKVISSLNSTESLSKKLEYLKIQKRIAVREIKCLKQVMKHPFSYKSLLKDKYPDMIMVLRSYSKYADEKIEFGIPRIILILKPIIKIMVQGRYIWIIKREKIKYWKFLIEKERVLKNEIHVEGKGQIEFDFEKTEKMKAEDFEVPDKKEVLKIKTLTNFDLDKLVQGHKWIRSLTANMKDRDKAVALNDIKSDLKRIIKSLDIDDKIINNYMINYRLLKKDYPEAIHLISMSHYHLRVEKLSNKDNSGITIADIKQRLKKLIYYFMTQLEHVEEDLKFVESKRIVNNERDKPKSNGKRVIWIGSKEQLFELFFMLNSEGFIPSYDEEVIAGHFRIVNSEDKEIREKAIYPNSDFLWLGPDNDFAQLINELVDSGFSPKGSKYKNFSEHFQNRKGEPFKHLSQKNYFNNNFLNPNKRISEIVNKIKEV
jgi:hypothetical protein